MEALLVLLVLSAVLFTRMVLRSPTAKGAFGEGKVKALTGLFLGSKYRRIDNVTLPIGSRTTQIDHVIVSVYGVFVVETKNMSGWIFGTEKQRYWTQVLFQKKTRFQNPLRQNYLHVKVIEKVLGIPKDRIHSVVAFSGKARFRTEVPPNVVSMIKLPFYIRSFTEQVFTAEECDAMVQRLQDERLKPGMITALRHVKNVKRRDAAIDVCPRCGSKLVRRVARQGASAGSSFPGCSAYPKCSYTRALD